MRAAGAADGFGPITVEDNGPNDADGDDGEFLVVDLLLGTYLITETVPPAATTCRPIRIEEVVLSGRAVGGRRLPGIRRGATHAS